METRIPLLLGPTLCTALCVGSAGREQGRLLPWGLFRIAAPHLGIQLGSGPETDEKAESDGALCLQDLESATTQGRLFWFYPLFVVSLKVVCFEE